MNTNRSSDPLQDIATHFSALWRVLSCEGDAPRDPEETRLLVDRVRDALDRRLTRVENASVAFIANSFLVEDVAYDRTPTQILRVRHRDLQTLHALKTLHADQASNAVARDLLLREARLSMTLSHRNIVDTQIALRLSDGRPAIIFEWMPLKLSDRLNRGPLSFDEIQSSLRSVLSGLEAIHAAGLVHADISPDNLLLADCQLTRLKIADFGIALERGQRHADLQLAKAGHSKFSAPEQIEGHLLDDRADLYSCGQVLILLLARCPDGNKVAGQLAALARYLTQQDRNNRPESASAALERLMNISHD